MKTKDEVNTVKCAGLLIFGVFSFIAFLYLFTLAMSISTNGNYYRCEPSWVRYKIDYIFPARQISCFLYTEVKP